MDIIVWFILLGLVSFLITLLAAFVGCLRWCVLAILWAIDRSHPVTAGGEKFTKNRRD
ncbi:hypothetical protein [Paenibacillus polymyxa]|uniref:hypothetical protein n=1 Tax=Paenibacillus polymyxa TaxID=1406 RepID=UPI0025B712F5|nr:hypothetical protein [Paenibacillus polymyxa]MDN4090907.1 hypothetical protein [Paenibacillus polymyxa]